MDNKSLTEHILNKCVMTIIKEISNFDEILPSTNLIGEGLIDSLNLVEMIVQLEKNFGITIKLFDYYEGKLESVERIAAFIKERVKNEGSK